MREAGPDEVPGRREHELPAPGLPTPGAEA
jgi:hypothetical protein